MLAQPDGPLELYDLAADLGERNNVAEQHPEIVDEMKSILRSARTPSPVFAFGQDTYLGAK